MDAVDSLFRPLVVVAGAVLDDDDDAVVFFLSLLGLTEAELDDR